MTIVLPEWFLWLFVAYGAITIPLTWFRIWQTGKRMRSERLLRNNGITSLSTLLRHMKDDIRYRPDGVSDEQMLSRMSNNIEQLHDIVRSAGYERN